MTQCPYCGAHSDRWVCGSCGTVDRGDFIPEYCSGCKCIRIPPIKCIECGYVYLGAEVDSPIEKHFNETGEPFEQGTKDIGDGFITSF